MYIVLRYNKALKLGIYDAYMTILCYQFIYYFDQNEANFILSVLSFKSDLNLAFSFSNKRILNNIFLYLQNLLKNLRIFIFTLFLAISIIKNLKIHKNSYYYGNRNKNN